MVVVLPYKPAVPNQKASASDPGLVSQLAYSPDTHQPDTNKHLSLTSPDNRQARPAQEPSYPLLRMRHP
ncbi:uncharacterized protein LY79DRAFT_570080 [Colletotrichum navitas]|uniref:Uncharacterized protein n=1 Tax=Colletotrichum navitas TaxID=681940 RepID=A0AAD8UZW0_9PEZI|nr:uncharacterized protein LY79DRAFT_570080 [Colletotrichum navitas]KAK1570288.1 hypothetical protein LY79DRAFT_570080 [Colletotrichum navitas]